MSDLRERALKAKTLCAMRGIDVAAHTRYSDIDWLWREAYERKGEALDMHEFETMAGITYEDWFNQP